MSTMCLCSSVAYGMQICNRTVMFTCISLAPLMALCIAQQVNVDGDVLTVRFTLGFVLSCRGTPCLIQSIFIAQTDHGGAVMPSGLLASLYCFAYMCRHLQT